MRGEVVAYNGTQAIEFARRDLIAPLLCKYIGNTNKPLHQPLLSPNPTNSFQIIGKNK
jgi:hypothetical protein